MWWIVFEIVLDTCLYGLQCWIAIERIEHRKLSYRRRSTSWLLNVARPSFALIIQVVAGENRDTNLLSGVQMDQISTKHRQIFQLRFYSLRVFYHRPLISHCLVSLHLSTYFGSIYCVWRVSINMERMVSLKLSSRRCCPKLEAVAGHNVLTTLGKIKLVHSALAVNLPTLEVRIGGTKLSVLSEASSLNPQTIFCLQVQLKSNLQFRFSHT